MSNRERLPLWVPDCRLAGGDPDAPGLPYCLGCRGQKINYSIYFSAPKTKEPSKS